MDSYIKDLCDVIQNGEMENTYKMVWIRSIVETCVLEPSIQTIPFDKLSKKICGYYWNQTIYFDLEQSPNPQKRPEIYQIVVEEIERYRSLIEAELKHADKSDLKPSLNNFTTAIRPFKYLYGDYEFYTNLVDVAEGFFIIDEIQLAQNLSIQIANEYSERMELYAQFPISNRAQLKDRIEKEWVAYNYFLQIVNKYDNSEFFKKLETQYNQNVVRLNEKNKKE